MTALGVLHPGHSADDDYPRLEQLLGSDIRVDVVRVDIDDPEPLARAVEQLRLTGAEAVVWAGTRESFAPGWDGAQDRVRALARTAGLPASSTSFAFVHAAAEVAARRVAVAAPYTGTEAAAFADFLRAGGLEVTAVHAERSGDWDEARLLAHIRAADTPDAEAVLVPGTSLRTVAHLPALEEALGKPVLTAHQVTVWEALRLTDRRVNAPMLGVLFTREPIVQV
ncbi:decarboxylase [Streptomyces sp. NPDC006458]|uniref:aspartate racemase/maleate isomerase family protein n=1 Tax=Streptomyces sp. NPDC006458 TaxID=3154302 RepID=UPI0033A8D00F